MSFDFSGLANPFRRPAPGPSPALDPSFEAALTLRLTATLSDVSGPHSRWETSPAFAGTRTRPLFGSGQRFAAAAMVGLALVFVGVGWLQHGGANLVTPAGSTAESSVVDATYASFQQPTMQRCTRDQVPGPTDGDWCIYPPYYTASVGNQTPPPTPTPTATATLATATLLSGAHRTPPPTEQPTFPSPIPS